MNIMLSQFEKALKQMTALRKLPGLGNRFELKIDSAKIILYVRTSSKDAWWGISTNIINELVIKAKYSKVNWSVVLLDGLYSSGYLLGPQHVEAITSITNTDENGTQYHIHPDDLEKIPEIPYFNSIDQLIALLSENAKSIDSQQIAEEVDELGFEEPIDEDDDELEFEELYFTPKAGQ